MSAVLGWGRRAAVVAVVVALSAAVVAPGASGVRSVRGFDGTTIKVAGIGGAANFGSTDIGTKARLKRANDTNEVKGIKFQYLEFADDKADPATATSEIRRLVTQEGIFAILPDLSAVNPGSFLAQQHVPYVGYGFDGTYCSSKPSTKVWGFGFNGCSVPSAPSVLGDTYSGAYQYISKKTGKKHPSIVLFSNDNQSGKSSSTFGASSSTGAGFKVVYAKGSVPETTSDYSPYINTWMTSDGGKQPDSIFCLLATQCVPIWNGLKAAGFTGTYWTPLGIDLFAKVLQGTIASAFFNTQPSAGLTQMRADFAAAGAPSTTPIFAEQAYFAADMFISGIKTIIKQSGVKGITPDALQKVLSTQTWGIKGLVGPIKYPQSTVVPTPYCQELITSNGTAPWTVLLPYTCTTKTFKINPKFSGT
jgi:ABC-type branched-subunit amino acid transport system substrate-binding protein